MIHKLYDHCYSEIYTNVDKSIPLDHQVKCEVKYFLSYKKR